MIRPRSHFLITGHIRTFHASRFKMKVLRVIRGFSRTYWGAGHLTSRIPPWLILPVAFRSAHPWFVHPEMMRYFVPNRVEHLLLQLCLRPR
jgi:hypothetical protein